MATSIATAVSTGSIDPGRWRSLAVVLSAAFLVTLDFFVVNVSIPSIRAGLHASFADLQLASMDFFTVPTATFRVLFVFIVLSHDRRRVMHCNVTDHPSEEWTAQQIREAFPSEAPRYLIRDRDSIFGGTVVALTKGMGIEEVVTAPRSPWQNPYVERLIGSIRRECLDHVIVWNEKSLRRKLFPLLREVAHAPSASERCP